MAQANKRRYVFHFDLNNTILMKDDSKGISLTDNVSLHIFNHDHSASPSTHQSFSIGLSHRLQKRMG